MAEDVRRAEVRRGMRAAELGLYKKVGDPSAVQAMYDLCSDY